MPSILLAEDYDDLREMIKQMLEQEGYTVEAAANGQAASGLLHSRQFDLLILDWDLPYRSGIDVCRSFRQTGGVTPILMLTGKKGIDDKAAGFDAGADDYLTKPFHPKELAVRVKALLRRHPSFEPRSDRPQEPLIGTTISDRYLILSLLGRGSTGVIYKARHQLLNKFVALKVLHPQLAGDRESLGRFKREAQAASTLCHPNIVSVHDFGISASGLPFLVMDYLEGVSLADVIAREGHLPPLRAISIFADACDALSHAHRHGIIHRDIKPGNMMLIAGESDKEVLKILDFGIARLLDNEQARLTQTGEIVGSPMYMSPEQCLGKDVDGRSDIFSLGCVMYMTLCGSEPFVGANIFETMHKRTVQAAVPFSVMAPGLSIPACLETVVLRALNQDTNERHQSMEELKADIEKAAAQLS